MGNVSDQEYELHLRAEEALFVYVDGVAEATDGESALYGAGRMWTVLNRAPEEPVRGLAADLGETHSGLTALPCCV